MTLATKYKEQLDEIVNKCMEELSYEYDFFYIDYDKKEKSFYFDFYSGGEVSREYLSQDEAKGIESTKGTIWHIWGEDEMRESEGLKDIVKIDVENALEFLESKNKKGSR